VGKEKEGAQEKRNRYGKKEDSGSCPLAFLKEVFREKKVEGKFERIICVGGGGGSLADPLQSQHK